ncbi:T9SS type A sorting domain-containing protein [Kaistella antarctica]|uniref:Por secretion system C-terminal sorting domain n=1 Tax=Kaistella antarctica TaxID=266748 RepID=A0A3S4USY4_9FLAO|nr:T9SS type A sorting domain-containing protein [Kaistella antarctica]KEY19044.1 hypothetical protein HY04_11435 [Kaistella antarctica]SEW12272.1 Por secretion system C-terminal sorting domain-containing protein [Kaistella antarctica]VEH99001.1 Por secretion system C-terminal sorting domain [Kaistella antarctica]
MKKALLLLLFFTLCNFTFSQTAPPNTRLFQLNTIKGSVLSLVEMSENYVYHVGTTNSSEVGFDGLAATTVGLDDLYILKSNAANGTNVWFKNFNAGTNGTMNARYVHVDSSENVYVFGQFKGTITVNGRTINGVNANDAFLMKIDPNENAVWVQFFENGYNSIRKIKTVTDGTDTFIIYDNKLRRLNDVNGDVLLENSYGAEIQSVALKGSDLYLSGVAFYGDAFFGSQVIAAKSGFIVKGDKDASFTSALKTAGSNQPSVISDITFDSTGKLLLTGFNTQAINIFTPTQAVPYTYNPNSQFETNLVCYFTAKVNANLEDVEFFRTSSGFKTSSGYIFRADILSSKVNPTLTGFNVLLFVRGSFQNHSPFTNANSSTTTVQMTPFVDSYSLLLQSNNNGNYVSGSQPIFYGSNMSANQSKHSQSTQNIRIFKTDIKSSITGNVEWSKEKTSALGGTYSRQFSKHLKSAPNELLFTALVEGKGNFFGRQVSNFPSTKSRYITRLGVDGLPKWFANFNADLGKTELNVSGDYIHVDKDDNLLFISTISGLQSTFTDAVGTQVIFNGVMSSNEKVLIKINKDGILLWSKQLKMPGSSRFTVITDANADAYLLCTLGGYYIDDQQINGYSSVVKLDKNGIFKYGKSYNISTYSFIPVFDTNNTLYLFCEPINSLQSDYVLDGITIPTSTEFADHLMLKCDSEGNIIWGKNFYANSTNYNYSWPNDVVFDGENFVMMGNYSNYEDSDFVGLDLVPVPRVYQNVAYIPFFAKITPTGNVLWQKPLHSNNANTGAYTNIELDENKNSYMYYYAKDKVSFNGIEYSFDAVSGNKVLTKIDNSGNLKYFKSVDGATYGSNFIDVIGNDKINVTGFTTANNLLNYPVNNSRASNLYIATFGNLDSYYLTPIKDYLSLNAIEIENNPANANTFSFDLINNVDWTANSDQHWLNLSFLSLTEKNNFKNLISGNGDAKIIMSATTNTSGASRSATVVVSGTGVDSKSIIVTQSFILATGETKTFVTTLYPNPTADLLNIETKQNISKIEIYDLSGRLVKTGAGKDKQISVSNLNKGMYLIKLHTENGIINSKFIKN